MGTDIKDTDKVEVVRCKYCKYSEHWYHDKCRCFFWHETGIDVFNNGFCNYGKFKDGFCNYGKLKEVKDKHKQ